MQLTNSFQDYAQILNCLCVCSSRPDTTQEKLDCTTDALR